MKPLKPGYVQLERALSKLGIASRTVAREWIRAARVSVNGVVRTEPLFQVHIDRSKIEIDGKLMGKVQWRSLLLYKPRGVITTRQMRRAGPPFFL